MNLTRLRGAGGLEYLLGTISTGDQKVELGGLTDYYTQSGNPPGRWWGGGLAALGLASGQVVTHDQARRFLGAGVNPTTGAALGRKRADGGVLGFDCTFTVPKSVSALWAVADRATQKQIIAAHHRAVHQSLGWIERTVAQTRSGQGGIITEAVDGLNVGFFDHFTSRDGDPHLHVHAVIANHVQRSRDGEWVTLDSRALHKAAVAASELHENLLLDEMRRTMGWSFEERQGPERTSRAVVLDVAGVPSDVVDKFSGRDAMITERLAREVETFTQTQGRAPTRRERAVMHRDVWRATRKPKPADVEPLEVSMRRWRGILSRAGYDSRALLAAANHPTVTEVAGARVATDPVLNSSLAVHTLHALTRHMAHHSSGPHDTQATNTMDEVAVAASSSQITARSTWTRANVRAEVERLTRMVRCDDPATREAWVEAITDRALSMCVPLTATRYNAPTTAALALHGASVFDDPSARLYTHTTTLHAETTVLNAAASGGAHALETGAARTLLDDVETTRTGHPLGDDQRAAVLGVLTDTVDLSVIVGPAGTGKTTTMGALRSCWETTHGPGTVLGLTTSAQAATVLSDELASPCHTVAKWLHESIGDGGRQRAAQIASLHARQPLSPRGRRKLATLETTAATWRLRPGQLLVLDEASMTGTFALAELVTQARAAGAKIVLVGDPAQLDVGNAGGLLADLATQPCAHELTAVWRFHDQWERDASLRLRTGDDHALSVYADHDRIHCGQDEDTLEGAYQATLTDLEDGKTSLLIAATNEAVRDLNTRFTLDRRAAGAVDTTTLATLRGGQDAGAGDTITARKVDRTLRDDAGDFIRNGTLLVVARVGRDGSLIAKRHDTGTLITLPATYVRSHVDLGYAMTAHRAQGSTVDTAHVAIPTSAHLPRELLYVAMTRGRAGNTAWVGEGAPADADVRTEALVDQPTGLERLQGMLSAPGAQRSAHHVRDREHERTHTLVRLAGEAEHLAGLARGLLAAAPQAAARAALANTLGAPADPADPSYRRLRDQLAYLHHLGHDPADVLAQVSTDLHDDDVRDPYAVALWRLTRQSGLPDVTAPIDVPALEARDPELAAAIRRNRELADRRGDELAARAVDEPWPTQLGAPPAPGAARARWDDLIRRVSIYRETYEIDADTPLGDPPVETRTTQGRQHAQLIDDLSAWSHTTPPPTTTTTAAPAPTAAPHRLDGPTP